jgi:hypothetical protein
MAHLLSFFCEALISESLGALVKGAITSEWFLTSGKGKRQLDSFK